MTEYLRYRATKESVSLRKQKSRENNTQLASHQHMPQLHSYTHKKLMVHRQVEEENKPQAHQVGILNPHHHHLSQKLNETPFQSYPAATHFYPHSTSKPQKQRHKSQPFLKTSKPCFRRLTLPSISSCSMTQASFCPCCNALVDTRPP